MAKFEVNVVVISNIEPIEGADAIELAVVDDYRCVVRKGQYQKGDMAVYIPEGAIVPDDLLEVMGLTGKLAGKKGNRVKAIRLRGVLSQGVLYPLEKKNNTAASIGRLPCAILEFCFVKHDARGGKYEATKIKTVYEGDDVSEHLNITKYEPPIPTSMYGEVCRVGVDNALKYDIENIKKYPHVLVDDEEVVVTEKIHGSCCILALNAGINHPDLPNNSWIISKGLGSQGLAFRDNDNNKNNVYFRALSSVRPLLEEKLKDKGQMYIIGEVFGNGVQDLQYGCKQNELRFRVFDVYIGKPSSGRYANFDEMLEIIDGAAESVPVLYRGVYSKDKIKSLTNGFSVFDSKQIKEGIIIKPSIERRDASLGRVILKSVSENYLLRKGGTEYS